MLHGCKCLPHVYTQHARRVATRTEKGVGKGAERGCAWAVHTSLERVAAIPRNVMIGCNCHQLSSDHHLTAAPPPRCTDALHFTVTNSSRAARRNTQLQHSPRPTTPFLVFPQHIFVVAATFAVTCSSGTPVTSKCHQHVVQFLVAETPSFCQAAPDVSGDPEARAQVMCDIFVNTSARR